MCFDKYFLHLYSCIPHQIQTTCYQDYARVLTTDKHLSSVNLKVHSSCMWFSVHLTLGVSLMRLWLVICLGHILSYPPSPSPSPCAHVCVVFHPTLVNGLLWGIWFVLMNCSIRSDHVVAQGAAWFWRAPWSSRLPKAKDLIVYKRDSK